MSAAARPRVIVADDYPGMLAAVKRLLTPDCDIVDAVTDGEALIESATRLHPDVVVADLNLPLVNGLEACRRIKQAHPGIQIVVFTALADEAIMEEVLAAGAAAFMSKQSIGGELISAIKKAHADARPQL
jgi:DNA-binding NarL/FixJ family response regulator